MRQQDDDIALATHPLILAKHLAGLYEVYAVQVVGVTAGNTLCANLYSTDDTYFHAADVEHLMRYRCDTDGIVNLDIGTEIAEGTQPHQTRQRTAVELVVANGRGVEAHQVHQRHYRVRRYLVLVVHRVARAIVASREHQQSGVYAAQTVDNSRQLREVLNGGVHVVGDQNVDVT